MAGVRSNTGGHRFGRDGRVLEERVPRPGPTAASGSRDDTNRETEPSLNKAPTVCRHVLDWFLSSLSACPGNEVMTVTQCPGG